MRAPAVRSPLLFLVLTPGTVLAAGVVGAGTSDAPLPQGPDGDDERGWAHVGTCDIGALALAAQAPQRAGEPIPAPGRPGLLLLALGITAALPRRRT